jgi:hypothetical protein
MVDIVGTIVTGKNTILFQDILDTHTHIFPFFRGKQQSDCSAGNRASYKSSNLTHSLFCF